MLGSANPAAALIGTAVSSGVFAWFMWRSYGKQMRSAEVLFANQRSNFLEAGVTLELALGNLQNGLALARHDVEGSAGEIALALAEAEQAFRVYVEALRTLDDDDFATHFPIPDTSDIEEAKRLLAVDGDAMLGQLRALPSEMSTPTVLGRAWRHDAQGSPTGDLAVVVEAATAVRRGLVTAIVALEGVRDTVRRVAESETLAGRLCALERVLALSAATGEWAHEVEMGYAQVENAARTAQGADTVADGIEALQHAPKPRSIRAEFDHYVSALTDLLTDVAEVAGSDRSLQDAVVTLWNLTYKDTPQLAIGADALSTSFEAAVEGAEHLVLR